MQLYRFGYIAGVPTSAGSYSFTANCVDTNGTTASATFSIMVNATPSGAVLVTNISSKTLSPYTPWVFSPTEPYKTAGLYGWPAGYWPYGEFNPVYDALVTTGSLTGATFLRGAGSGGDIDDTVSADGLSFTISAQAKIHVAYPRTGTNQVPAWLASKGFTKTGTKFFAIRQDYYDYVKDFPAGTVALGPNCGTATTAPNPYLVIIEPENGVIGVKAPLKSNLTPAIQIDGARRLLTLKGFAKSALIRVLSPDGRTVVSEKSQSGKGVYSLKSLSGGVYIVRVSSENGSAESLCRLW